MKEFFKVQALDQVFEYIPLFKKVRPEEIPLDEAFGRILAEDIVSDEDLPDFSRSTMDGYAVCASSTFGASEANPAYLSVKGSVSMGEITDFSIGPGEAARISTGGMIPDGANSVIMIEHTDAIDDLTIEAYRSVAPGQHVIEKGEDFRKGETILERGRKIRPPELGLLAAFGKQMVTAYKMPVVGIISTGDEIVSIDTHPGPGKIRDINTYTLLAKIREAGGVPIPFGIVRDSYDALYRACTDAIEQTDMVLISGGSSVGVRDFTIEALSALPESGILVHGISISPGKPTILAQAGGKAVWGIPGHVVSAMVVFEVVVRPFVEHIGGSIRKYDRPLRIPARLSRNIPSAQGRVDFIRVRLLENDGLVLAEPILGKSGLLNTMVQADGLVEIGINVEGLDKGTEVEVIPI